MGGEVSGSQIEQRSMNRFCWRTSSLLTHLAMVPVNAPFRTK